jgi:uncharacterized protein YuzE
MRITFDKNANAVEIQLTKDRDYSNFVYPCDPREIGGMINLDFNKEGKLIGIEIMDATKFVPKEILDNAEIISRDRNLLPKINIGKHVK